MKGYKAVIAGAVCQSVYLQRESNPRGAAVCTKAFQGNPAGQPIQGMLMLPGQSSKCLAAALQSSIVIFSDQAISAGSRSLHSSDRHDSALDAQGKDETARGLQLLQGGIMMRP